MVKMTISITKGYVDFMYKGKIVRGWGDMCSRNFPLIVSAIEWIFPGKRRELNDGERNEFIEEVMKQQYRLSESYKVVFTDDNGRIIKKRIKKGKGERSLKKETKKKIKEAMRLGENSWDFWKSVILDFAENDVCISEKMERSDEKRNYILMKKAIADNVSLITVNQYLRILGTSDSVYESTVKFSDMFQEIFKERKNIIAYDIFGGLFAEEGWKIHYFAPDSLKWVETMIGYEEFVIWSVNGNVSEFYQPLLWDGFEEMVSKVSPGEGISAYPFSGAKEYDICTASRKIVPFKEILEMNYQNMVLINGVGTDNG